VRCRWQSPCSLVFPGIPGDLSPDITNPWFPLVPGRKLYYAKVTPDGVERITVEALDETRSRMELLSVPGELEPQTREMKDALAALRGAWQEYIEYMTGSSSKFDEAEARPYLNRIGESWQRFRKGHKQATRLVSERM